MNYRYIVIIFVFCNVLSIKAMDSIQSYRKTHQELAEENFVGKAFAYVKEHPYLSTGIALGIGGSAYYAYKWYGKVQLKKAQLEKAAREREEARKKVIAEEIAKEETFKLKVLFQKAYWANERGNYFDYNAWNNFRFETEWKLKNGANPNGFIADDSIQMPFLFAAVRMGNPGLTKLLLQSAANPNLPTSGGNNALIEGLNKIRDFRGYNPSGEEIVLSLLEHGADPNFISNYNASALSIAVSSNSPCVVKKLLDNGARIPANSLDIMGGKQLCQHKMYNATIAQILLNAGFNENIKDEAEDNALIRAARDDFPIAISKVFLDNGWRVNIRNKVENTALLYAVYHGEEKKAKLLIDAGANVNINGAQGYTALINAIWGSSPIGGGTLGLNIRKKMLELLIASGADPNIADNNGETPLRHAIVNGIKSYDFDSANVIIEILFEAGVDPNIADNNEETH